MPFLLKPADVLARVAGARSVLIVPCRFCPAASMAVRTESPYLEPLRRGFGTGAYESFLKDLRRQLTGAGIETAVFDSRLPHHFVACMWTARRRRKLARRAAAYEAVVVLGCGAAVETVAQSLGDADVRILPGMEVDGGIMNVVPRVELPLRISLEMASLSPYGPTGAS